MGVTVFMWDGVNAVGRECIGQYYDTVQTQTRLHSFLSLSQFPDVVAAYTNNTVNAIT